MVGFALCGTSMFVNKYEQTNLTIKIVLKIHPHLVIKQHQTS